MMNGNALHSVKPCFVHLRAHSEYSIIHGISRIAELVKYAQKTHMPAIALTDTDNIFAAIKLYVACRDAGIKPIIGCDVSFGDEHGVSLAAPVTLLACNTRGFGSLTQLVNLVQKDGVIGYDALSRLQAGLILLSGGFGYAAQLFKIHKEMLQVHLLRCCSIFKDRFYLAIERVNTTGEASFNDFALDLAAQHGLAIVATNGSYFDTKADFQAHEIRTCINSGHKIFDHRRERYFTKHQYLKSPAEIEALFADIPAAITNSVEIAKRCNLEIPLFVNQLPTFPLPDGYNDIDAYFGEKVTQGFAARLPHLDDSERLLYTTRLENEVTVIKATGFVGYFLIVMEFIQWAKQQGIPVGPGRGSGAGSLVAYVLHITDVEPIRYGLLFERFLNPERKSMPDFDIDFCVNRRDEVIHHVKELYGADAVAQIATFGTLAAKAVIRDVVRVLGHPYAFGDALTQYIPSRPIDIKLQDAIDQSSDMQDFINEDERAQEIIAQALRLEGLVRNVGTHPGGVVIAPRAIHHYTALYFDDKGGQSTQFDKDDLEKCGIIKFDVLGVKTLTVIDQALALVNQSLGMDLSILDIDIQDSAIYKLITTGNTVGVFQLESGGMRRLIRRLLPDQFSDVVALVALYRPGPLGSGMIDSFINTKHGQQEAQYPSPELKPILEETYGVILYQEQVMQIAQQLAHYSMGEADLLRRSMGKKDKVIMDQQREKFCDQVSPVLSSKAKKIFDLMAEFANYGFNKSHSVAYAIIACQTAWLKARYPLCFMVANCNCDIDKTEQLVKLYHESCAMGIEVIAPHVNQSDYVFTIDATGCMIVYGLGGVKGIGKNIADAIADERQLNGKFIDFIDFCLRIPASNEFNKKALDGLIESGALDNLGYSRYSMSSASEEILKAARMHQQNKSSGQDALFGDDTDVFLSEHDIAAYACKHDAWPSEEILHKEHKVLGVYLSDHPINLYRDECRLLSALTPTETVSRANGSEETFLIVGVVVNVMRRTSPTVHYVIFLEDATTTREIAVSVDMIADVRDVLKMYQIIVARVRTRHAGQGRGLDAESVQTMQQACSQLVLVIYFPATQFMDTQIQVMDILTKHQQPDGSLVVVNVVTDQADGYFALPAQWHVDATVRNALSVQVPIVRTQWKTQSWFTKLTAN